MKTQRLFLFLSFLVVIAIVGVVINKIVPREELELFLTDGTIPATFVKSSNVASTTEKSGIFTDEPVDDVNTVTDSELSQVSSTLADHTLDASPESDLESLQPSEQNLVEWNELTNSLSSLKKIDSIPWELSEIERGFNASSKGSCRILRAGEESEIFPEPVGTQSQNIMRYRISSAIIGLTLSANADHLFNGIGGQEIKRQVQTYFRDHKLVLQSQILQLDNERSTFSGPLIATFIPTSGGTVTVNPDKLIVEAMENIRFLGALHNEADGVSTIDTLVFAFKYRRSATGSSSSTDILINDYELVLFHIVKGPFSYSSVPEVVVFCTTDSRQKIHRLKPLTLKSRSAPNIRTEVSFGRLATLGQPSDPFTVSVKADSVSSYDTNLIKNRLAGTNQLEPILLPDLLNELAISK